MGRAMTVVTVRVAHDRFTGHVQRMSLVPLAAAKRAASCVGDPCAPNCLNVTGAAASAAASAAPAACTYPATPAPTAPTATASIRTSTSTPIPSTIEPSSSLDPHG